MIPLTHSELQHVQKTQLVHDHFEWGEGHSGGAIALDYGSLYNHAYESNVEYGFQGSELAIDFIARRDIAAGEELTINYDNTGGMALAPIRFDYRDLDPRQREALTRPRAGRPLRISDRPCHAERGEHRRSGFTHSRAPGLRRRPRPRLACSAG